MNEVFALFEQFVAVCSSIYFNTWYLRLQYWYFSCFKVFWFKQHQQHIGSQCHRTLKRDQISAPHEPKIHVKRKKCEPKISLRCTKCMSSCDKPVIGIRHEEHRVLLVQRPRCRPLLLAEMCPIGERLIPGFWGCQLWDILRWCEMPDHQHPSPIM